MNWKLELTCWLNKSEFKEILKNWGKKFAKINKIKFDKKNKYFYI